ncbi:MAG: hypothetical protein CO139_02595, partial [Candidatus Moranbacteria bacterium CG_4_9_14_3_um_filter_36_9]
IAIIIYAITHKTKPLEIKPIELKAEEVADLEWILTSDERRDVSKKIIIRLLYASISVLFGFLFLRIIELEISLIKYFVFLYILIIVIAFVPAYIYTLLSKPKKLIYNLTNQGVIVSKGTEKGEFNWSDFAYFYINYLEIQDVNKNSRDEEKKGYFNKMRNICGETYYLKLNPTGIFSKINIIERSLVIYTNPDNYQKVYVFLLTKLQQKPAENIGFQKYYFK